MALPIIYNTGNKVAEEYGSFADFIKTQKIWFAIMGIEMADCRQYIKSYIQLDSSEQEEYYVIKGDDEHLTVSEIVIRNDGCCQNHINVTTGNTADKESILK